MQFSGTEKNSIACWRVLSDFRQRTICQKAGFVNYIIALHEMVTGKKAFEGKSRVLLIAAIATSDPPPLSTVEPTASRALDHVVKTCLAKEPSDRWQTSRDLLAELEWVAAGGGENTGAATPAPWKRQRVWLYRAALGAAGLLAGVGAASASLYFRGPAASDKLEFRVPIQLTAETTVAGGNSNNPGSNQGYRGVSGSGVFNPDNFAISPDGRALAFVARANSNNADAWFLYVRPAGAVTPQRLAGTENATFPFWSADGNSIAFVAGGKLKRVEAKGGPAQEICEAPGFQGGAWNSAGIILFGSAQGLQRVPAEGGKPEPLTHLAESETGHYWPHFLPDGRHYLYTAWSGQAANRSIMAGTLDAPDQKTRVLPVGSNAGYSEPGYIVFHRDNAVYAQPFSAGSLKVSGEPERIANEITFDGANGLGNFSVSPKAALAYFFSSSNAGAQTGAQTDLSEWQLSWIGGGSQQAVGRPGVYRGVEFFAKTNRVAVHRHDANGGDIVVFEPGGSDLRLTTNASQHNSMPVWSPDGSQIVFASLRAGKWGLYAKLSTGSGTEQMLYESDLPAAPMSWVASDGKQRIVFWVQDPKTLGDLWMLTLDGDKWKPEKLIAEAFNETHGQISPDGKWIAYTDNSKDKKNEVYVQAFPKANGKFQISDDGGDWPRWRGDSKEIFYHSIGSQFAPGNSLGASAFSGILYSVAVKANGADLAKEGLPRQVVVFPIINLPHSGGSYNPYAVSPDGKSFLIPQYVPSTGVVTGSQIGPDTFSGLTVAINWPSSLKK